MSTLDSFSGTLPRSPEIPSGAELVSAISAILNRLLRNLESAAASGGTEDAAIMVKERVRQLEIDGAAITNYLPILEKTAQELCRVGRSIMQGEAPTLGRSFEYLGQLAKQLLEAPIATDALVTHVAMTLSQRSLRLLHDATSLPEDIICRLMIVTVRVVLNATQGAGGVRNFEWRVQNGQPGSVIFRIVERSKSESPLDEDHLAPFELDEYAKTGVVRELRKDHVRSCPTCQSELAVRRPPIDGTLVNEERWKLAKLLARRPETMLK